MTCEMKMHKTILRPWSRHDTWFKANQVNTSLQISWLWRHSSEEKKNKLCAHLNRFSLRTVTTCNFSNIWHLRRQNCQRDCDILTDSWCIWDKWQMRLSSFCFYKNRMRMQYRIWSLEPNIYHILVLRDSSYNVSRPALITAFTGIV